MPFKITLCVSCKIALGKLRRVTNIAHALRQRGDVSLFLLANSGPKGVHESLNPDELALFDHIEDSSPDEMTKRLKSFDMDVVVVDTMNPRDLHDVHAQLCLILREVLSEEIKKFRLKDGRAWDLVILPHPANHWMPPDGSIAAKKIEPVGWIFRRPISQTQDIQSADAEVHELKLLITTGGGSGEDRGNDIRSDITDLIYDLRRRLHRPIKIFEVIGPRDWNKKSIEGVDETLRPGPELQNLFGSVDLVMSAAGYNTVLELACTDVPVLLIPVPRYTDDQEKRARLWGDLLGMCYDPNDKERSINWMAHILESRLRRAVVDLGTSGAERAAALICQFRKSPI